MPEITIEPVLQESTLENKRQESIQMIWLRLGPILVRSIQDGETKLNVSETLKHTWFFFFSITELNLSFLVIKTLGIGGTLNEKWMPMHPLAYFKLH